jgi:hypothetical protein
MARNYSAAQSDIALWGEAVKIAGVSLQPR